MLGRRPADVVGLRAPCVVVAVVVAVADRDGYEYDEEGGCRGYGDRDDARGRPGDGDALRRRVRGIRHRLRRVPPRRGRAVLPLARDERRARGVPRGLLRRRNGQLLICFYFVLLVNTRKIVLLTNEHFLIKCCCRMKKTKPKNNHRDGFSVQIGREEGEFCVSRENTFFHRKFVCW